MGCVPFVRRKSPMKSIALIIVLILCGVSNCNAQSKPTEDCVVADDGFATTPGQKVQIAEVVKRAAVRLMACGTPEGCMEANASWGSPIQIYRQQGEWTCGYMVNRDGAGSTWIRTDSLRVVPYDEHPPIRAWVGTWTWITSEHRIRISSGKLPGSLHLAGHTVWRGSVSTQFGQIKGTASPVGNHLHFVDSGPESCTVDMTLLNRFLLVNDNGLCGGVNANFGGIWKRTSP
jgi:hypothetical protein